MSRHIPLAVLACCFLLCPTVHAQSEAERFPFTYGWMTAPKGELELEIRHTQPASARFWQDEVSVEIGVTPRYTIEPYLVYNKSGGFRDIPATQASGDADEGGAVGGGSGIFDPIHNGAAYRYGGVRLEQRYRFGDYHRRRLLSAAYVEYENLRGTQVAETKYIGQFDPTRQSTFIVNLIQETPLSHGGPTEWGYSLGGAYLADKRNDRYWYGAEAFGSWSGNSHWAGPSAGFYINNETRLVGTYGKQYKGQGGDKFQLMLTRGLN